jgi:acetoin utilization deacetylase AcuC-like enzyme
MKTFAHAAQAGHTPSFFLQRGQVRRNFEIPARAAALEAALHRLGLPPETPPPLAPRALESVHRADYLDYLATAAAEWAKLPDPGPEVVANIHPVPEMVAQGGRTGASIIARTGWYTADTACPIGPGTWDASQGAAACALAAAAEAAKGRTAYALCRPPGHHAYAGARAGIATSTMRHSPRRRCGMRARRASPCSTSTATTATAPRASSGSVATC